MPASYDDQSFEQRKESYIGEHLSLGFGLLAVFWSLLVVYSHQWNTTNLYEEKITLATSEARSLWNKDQAFRRWATEHGGVYVKPDERTPPNPYLEHLPKRDIETKDGTRLTLMNPAYMMRQMTQEFEDSYGIKGKITGEKQLNPINAPDDWELDILRRFAAGDTAEQISNTTIAGTPYLRYMKPMFMSEGCVKCHGILGYKTGDLRGGVSISIPLTPYFNAAEESGQSIAMTHLAVWMIGSLGLLLFWLHSRHKQAERNQLLEKLEQNALYDQLTGLPSRLLFTDRLRQALKIRSRNSDYNFAVCFLDLDRFKQINDVHGHSVGDMLLRKIGDLLREQVRPADTVARLGGDEYILLLCEINGVEQAVHICERIIDQLTQPLLLNNQYVEIGGSIGISTSSDSSSNPDEMIRDADTAMYQAKRAGRGRVDVFDPQLHDEMRAMIELEAGLRQALERNQFAVYYQPLIDLADRSIHGFEALIRWHDPNMGMIPPDRFIPVAEDIGIIGSIGEWVLAQAAGQLAQWQPRITGKGPLSMSVNLSTRQLMDPKLPAKAAGIVRAAGVEPSSICFEVTETAFILDQGLVRKHIAMMRESGFRFAADDFGTGYSSLTYLAQYRFDVLKIDKRFVQDIGVQDAGLKLCRALVGLGDDLGLAVVAEGVETAEQLEQLTLMGCSSVQGYYFSRPLPPEEIEQNYLDNPSSPTFNLMAAPPITLS